MVHIAEAITHKNQFLTELKVQNGERKIKFILNEQFNFIIFLFDGILQCMDEFKPLLSILLFILWKVEILLLHNNWAISVNLNIINYICLEGGWGWLFR